MVQSCKIVTLCTLIWGLALIEGNSKVWNLRTGDLCPSVQLQFSQFNASKLSCVQINGVPQWLYSGDVFLDNTSIFSINTARVVVTGFFYATSVGVTVNLTLGNTGDRGFLQLSPVQGCATNVFNYSWTLYVNITEDIAPRSVAWDAVYSIGCNSLAGVIVSTNPQISASKCIQLLDLQNTTAIGTKTTIQTIILAVSISFDNSMIMFMIFEYGNDTLKLTAKQVQPCITLGQVDLPAVLTVGSVGVGIFLTLAVLGYFFVQKIG